jgi:hypothetical protein
MELSDSRARLESVLGRSVTLFSFPHGAYNAGTLSLAKAAGYDRVFTIVPELNSTTANAFVIGRVAVEPDDWPLEFRLKVLGAYRWMAGLPRRTRRAANRSAASAPQSASNPASVLGSSVPEGHSKIAQRFNVGWTPGNAQVPEGRPK